MRGSQPERLKGAKGEVKRPEQLEVGARRAPRLLVVSYVSINSNKSNCIHVSGLWTLSSEGQGGVLRDLKSEVSHSQLGEGGKKWDKHGFATHCTAIGYP